MDFMAWLNATVWACFLPFVLIGSAFGIVSGPYASAMQLGAGASDNSAPGFELVVGLMSFVLKSFVALMAFMVWPAMTAFMYGVELDKIYPDQIGNLMVLAVFGVGIGTWAALKVLPLIDQRLGIEPGKGISWAVRAFCFAGQAYAAIKVVKAGRSIIRKI
jgi:hypothetical protein